VVEYDEPFHDIEIFKERDGERQSIIEDFMDVNFIRVKDEDMIIDPEDVRKKLLDIKS
jgi:hypothetical protein